MKAAASLLLALFALTSGIAVRGPLGACGALALHCTRKPCCKPAAQDMPTVRAKMACCDVAPVTEQRVAPAVTRHAPAMVVALLDAPLVLPAAISTRIERTTVPPAPRGPPIYLRNRSLLL